MDEEKRIIAALVGQPDDPEWSEVIDAATAVMQEVQQLGMSEQLFSEKHLDHRHGEFLAIPVGVSFGGGQTVRIDWLSQRYRLLTNSNLNPQEPGNLIHTKAMHRLIRKMLKSPHILATLPSARSIAQYAAGGLFRWVAYGFKSAKSLLKTKPSKLLKKRIDKDPGKRWREGLAMFSKLDELQEPCS